MPGNKKKKQDTPEKRMEDELIGVSSHMCRLREEIKKTAAKDNTVLILGPTGTGKELVAKWVRKKSGRSDKRYFPIDCGAIPENLFESELFGYKKGAFTGADKDSLGKVGLAKGGTLFLDEVGNLSKEHQGKILRFLNDGSYLPVGGDSVKQSDARIIAATNDEYRLRGDLLARLSQRVIRTKALKDTNSWADIVCLVRHYIPRKEFKPDPKALFLLYCYDYPNNVRELKGLAEQSDDFEYVMRETLISFIKNHPELSKNYDTIEIAESLLDTNDKADPKPSDTGRVQAKQSPQDIYRKGSLQEQKRRMFPLLFPDELKDPCFIDAALITALDSFQYGTGSPVHYDFEKMVEAYEIATLVNTPGVKYHDIPVLRHTMKGHKKWNRDNFTTTFNEEFEFDPNSILANQPIFPYFFWFWTESLHDVKPAHASSIYRLTKPSPEDFYLGKTD